MKKLIYFCIGVMVLSGTFMSCTKDFELTNTSPNNSPEASAQQLMAPALVNIMTYNMLRNRNFNNELMQVTVDMSDADGKVFRYDFRSNWSDYTYNGWYNELTNLKDMYNKSTEALTLNTSYQGISLILQSWVYSLLTDTYGDIPYVESNRARDSILEPKFDLQKDIYDSIFKRLEDANNLLKLNKEIYAPADPIYNGDVVKWRKFGNALYLRLLLRISGKAEVAPAVIAKITEILQTKASNYPIIANNAESAVLRWTGVGEYVTPLVSVREQDYRAPAIAEFFIQNLSNWSDPRIDAPTWGTLSGTTKYNRWGIAPYSGAYLGTPSGYSPIENPIKRSYFYSNTNGVSLQKDAMTGLILTYAEVQFIFAEAVVKGWITTGTAASYYNAGADASIKLWLPNWTGDIATFLSSADIEWIDTATPDEKMEKIHLQKYYALFMTDMQQWFEYRRTGHPTLPKGAGLRNGGVMPARMTYPIYVQSTNPTNYKIAVSRQGDDNIATQVWWQKP